MISEQGDAFNLFVRAQGNIQYVLVSYAECKQTFVR